MNKKEFEYWWVENYWWVLYSINSIMLKEGIKEFLTTKK